MASKSFELKEPVSHITSAVTFSWKQSCATLELLMIKSRFIADVHLQKKEQNGNAPKKSRSFKVMIFPVKRFV